MNNRCSSLSVLLCLAAVFVGWAETPLALVPMPREVKRGNGVFTARAGTPLAELVRHQVKSSLPPEGYELEVDGDGIRSFSADEAGRFYALKTLEQLVEKVGGQQVLPFVAIRDFPAYRWRGLMMDEARRFLGKETVLREIELASRHKLNVFHWHLVDDQGWRLEIKCHPELVEYGAKRSRSVAYGSMASWPPPDHKLHYEFNTEPNGPFYYTHEDVQEILAYAKARHVTVVPEIELPGHVRALLAARPDLGCRGSELERRPRELWSIEDDVLCVGNDDALRYMKDILDEVCGLFPEAQVIHIGGDECPKKRWKACPKCQARKAALRLADERGLQAWFTSQIAAHLAAKGRRALGWDEVLHGDVPKNVIGMSWRTSARGGAGGDWVSPAEALARGFEMVMAPNRQCYFSRPQGLSDDPYVYYSHSNPEDPTLRTAFDFDPAANIDQKLRKGILGAEACVWGESVWTRFDFEWKTWPRACALAEALWTAAEDRDYYAFLRRLEEHRSRLVADHVNCAPFAADRVSGGTVTLSTTNACCEVALYGARVMSFRKKGGEDVLWRPRKWRIAGERWSHGGIPLCWPWFGASGPDPKVMHGFAWKTPFEVRSLKRALDKCELVLGMRLAANSRKDWPYATDLEYRITLTDRLRLELRTANQDVKPFKLTAGFHPYFRLGERDRARITGTDGMASCDSRISTEYTRVWKGELPLDHDMDDVFVEKGATAFHSILDPVLKRRINERSRGAARLVVWNPGEEEDCEREPGAGELAFGDWRRLVCMEPAILWQEAALTVAPGDVHVLETELSVEKLASR